MHDYATGAMAAQVAMNTTLSAATGGITVFILAYLITRKYDVGGLCNGILAGVGKGWRKMENVFFHSQDIILYYIYTHIYHRQQVPGSSADLQQLPVGMTRLQFVAEVLLFTDLPCCW